jgi:hypothetical protein
MPLKRKENDDEKLGHNASVRWPFERLYRVLERLERARFGRGSAPRGSHD